MKRTIRGRKMSTAHSHTRMPKQPTSQKHKVVTEAGKGAECRKTERGELMGLAEQEYFLVFCKDNYKL